MWQRGFSEFPARHGAAKPCRLCHDDRVPCAAEMQEAACSPAPGTNAARYHLRHPFPLGPTKLHRAVNPARQRDLQHIVGGNGRGGLETELELSTDRKGD